MLFFKQREDHVFFDRFTRKDVANSREERFNEELLALFKRSQRNQSVSPHLVEQMGVINTQLKKDYFKATKRMSRHQVKALDDYSLTYEINNKASS